MELLEGKCMLTNAPFAYIQGIRASPRYWCLGALPGYTLRLCASSTVSHIMYRCATITGRTFSTEGDRRNAFLVSANRTPGRDPFRLCLETNLCTRLGFPKPGRYYVLPYRKQSGGLLRGRAEGLGLLAFDWTSIGIFLVLICH